MITNYLRYHGSVCEVDNTGSVQATNTYGAEGMLSRHTPTSGLWQGQDLFGNNGQTLDDNGNIQNSSIYDLFGQHTSNVLPGSDGVSVGYGIANGNYRDPGTGLQYPPGNGVYNPGSGTSPSRAPRDSAGGHVGAVANHHEDVAALLKEAGVEEEPGLREALADESEEKPLKSR